MFQIISFAFLAVIIVGIAGCLQEHLDKRGRHAAAKRTRDQRVKGPQDSFGILS